MASDVQQHFKGDRSMRKETVQVRGKQQSYLFQRTKYRRFSEQQKSFMITLYQMSAKFLDIPPLANVRTHFAGKERIDARPAPQGRRACPRSGSTDAPWPGRRSQIEYQASVADSVRWSQVSGDTSEPRRLCLVGSVCSATASGRGVVSSDSLLASR